MFTGRRYHLESLEALWRKRTASLAVVSGRRRIGKSALVEQFAARSRCRFIEIAGLAPEGKGVERGRQLGNFAERLAKATGGPVARAETWGEAFDALDAAVKGGGGGRTVVFLDEISWMGAGDPDFPALLKNAWDMQLSKHPRLVLVLAGSVSAWIRENILGSKAFVGRVSLDISLGELPLANCRDFWGKAAGRVSAEEMLDVLSVTGGVPKYLEEVDPGAGADENIRRLCFRPEGYLFRDFENLFGDVFGAAAAKRRILEALAEGPASVTDLAERFGVRPNGHFGDDLRDLAEAGFVAGAAGRNPATGGAAREVKYRLKDNYTRFYLKFVEPKKEAIAAGLFRFASLDRLPGWEATMGLQFENLVLNQLKTLCGLIDLGPRLVTSAAPYWRRGGKGTPGVQVDLLLQTPKSMYVVEVKRRRHIGAEVEEEVQRKVERLGAPKGVSVRTVLVHAGRIAPEVEENGYFDHLVSAERLFEAAESGD